MADKEKDIKEPEIDESAAEAAAIVAEIEKALQAEDMDECSFEFPISEALSLIPKRYRKAGMEEETTGHTIVIRIDNLFDQLAAGKVSMPVSGLAYFVPLHLVYHAALDDNNPVTLPLPTVIRQVGIKTLGLHTPETVRAYNTEDLDDPFTEKPASATDSGEEEKPVMIAEKSAPIAPQEKEDPKATPPKKTPPKPAAKETPQEPKPEPAVAPPAEDLVRRFQYPAADAIRLMPETYVAESAAESAGQTSITIELPDLYDQLRTGRVAVTAGVLASLLPPGSVTDEARADKTTAITLSLGSVVKSVGIDAFKRQVPERLRRFDIDRMADPFTEPDVLPKLTRTPKPPRPTTEDRPRQAAPTAKAPAAVKATRYEPSADTDSEIKYRELPGNVNINTASMNELLMLDGMNMVIAERIIAFRETHHGFRTVFQLLEIKGIGGAEFKKMTGMTPEQKRYHRRKRLASLLRIPPEQVNNLDLIAGRFSGRTGFSGCVIADRDGLVLAAHGMDELGENLSAITPKMVHHIRHNMAAAEAGNVGTITMSIENTLYTISAMENVTLIVRHDESGISQTELSLIRKISKELGWMLSVRAYVGPHI